MIRPTRLGAGLSAAAVLAAMTAAAGAQEARPFLTFEHSGLGRALADSRDAALRDALAMLPARIAELPGEIPDMPEEAAGFLQLALRTVARPARVAVVYDGDNPSGGFFGYGFLASIECENEEEARELQGTVLAITQQISDEQGVEFMFEPSDRFEGMSEMLLPFGLLSFGPRRGEGGWRYELIVGTMNSPDGAFAEPPRLIDTPGFETWTSGVLDFRQLTPLTRIVTNFAGANAPEATMFIGGIEEMGLVGEDAMRLEFQAGNSRRHSIQRSVVRNARPYAQKLSLPTEALTHAELGAIPSDVHGVTIGRASFQSLGETMTQLDQQGLPVSEALDEFERMTGVDLVEDVFDTLGGTFAMYNAESTGGGSMLSAVMMVTIEDHDRFAEAVENLAEFANGAIHGSGPAGRYVRLEFWRHEGVGLLGLRFPGVPVPLEVTFALTDDWFIAALSPQAALAAGLQASGKGDGGLTANPRFAGFFSEHGAGATAVSFVDSPRTLRSGYPFMSLIASAISNAVRSPEDPRARNPGMILPLYNDLVNDEIVPTVRISRWDGDDMVTTTWADRSVWVQTGSSLGVASSAVPLVAAGIGAMAVADQMQLGMVPRLDDASALASLVRGAFVVDPVARANASLGAILGQFAPSEGDESANR